MLIDEFLTDGLIKEKSFQYTNYNNEVFILEGMKNLLLCQNDEIILKIKQGEISVKGNNLKIKELGKAIICITGKIHTISLN